MRLWKSTYKPLFIWMTVLIGVIAIVMSRPEVWEPVSFVHLDAGWGQAHLVNKENYIFYVQGKFLEIVDVSDSQALLHLSQFKSNYGISDIAIFEEVVLIASTQRGLQVIDISDPHTPKLISEFPAKEFASYAKIIVVGDYAYVYGVFDSDSTPLSQGTRLSILDISNPLKIRELSSIVAAGVPLAVQGNYLYTLGKRIGEGETHERRWLNIVDLSDVHFPKVLFDAPTFRDVMDANIQGDYLYVATEQGIIVADISNPTTPIEVGRTKGSAFQIIINGNYLYYTVLGRVGVYDISDPTHPKKIAHNDDVYASDISISNGNVYFGVYLPSGIQVFEGWEE